MKSFYAPYICSADRPQPARKPNWPIIGTLVVCVMFWVGIVALVKAI